ncbi:MAG TPA: hypothetical protein EYN07_03950 [Flavobacteriaceae bacterium]|nr:hypothetical protein [Flavobacteriaceae bacterium]HIB49033.1 hypothetical protein [Flavobacteriaceae bacterium]HIN98375.1 hypothetical protein [Flavobacteriaceae bacterium]|tara:strand:- start:874 stop:1059 length:186 start_codon:yes stop_codon:yes gene_type:complete
MLAIDFYNPYIVIFGLLVLAVLVFFWNKKNTTNNRNRRQRNFKSGYLERKKEREAKENQKK